MRPAPILAVAGRELRSLFGSPLAWCVLAAVQAILGYTLVLRLDVYLEWRPRLAALPSAPGVTTMVVAPVLHAAAAIMLSVVPLLSMRLVAGERRAGTLPLLLSAPLTATEIVLGKYLGLLGMLGAQLALVALLPLALLAGGTLDPGHLAAAVLGVGLLLAGYAAIGLLVSSWCEQPAVAALITFGALLGLWIIEPRGATPALRLTFSEHLDPLLRGLVDSADLAYFAVVIALALALAVRRLEALRLRG